MAWFAAEASLFTCAHPVRSICRRAAHTHGNAHAQSIDPTRTVRGPPAWAERGTAPGQRRQQALGKTWHLDNDL